MLFRSFGSDHAIGKGNPELNRLGHRGRTAGQQEVIVIAEDANWVKPADELEGLIHMAVVTNQIAEANDRIGRSQIIFDREQRRKVGMNITDDCYAHIQQRGRELNRLKKTVADTRSSGALLRSRHPNSNLLQDHFDR